MHASHRPRDHGIYPLPLGVERAEKCVPIFRLMHALRGMHHHSSSSLSPPKIRDPAYFRHFIVVITNRENEDSSPSDRYPSADYGVQFCWSADCAKGIESRRRNYIEMDGLLCTSVASTIFDPPSPSSCHHHLRSLMTFLGAVQLPLDNSLKA